MIGLLRAVQSSKFVPLRQITTSCYNMRDFSSSASDDGKIKILKQDIAMQSRADKKIFPDNWVTKLTNRSILSIRGRDATDLLQNTTTQDMNLFKESEDRAAIYTSFLTVKGKTMYDAIVVKPKLAAQTDEDMEYWVDIHEEDIDALRKHLRRYALRKNLQIEDISHIIKSFSIQSLLGINRSEENKEGYFYPDLQDRVEMFESDEFPGRQETDIAAFVDPRSVSQGVRVLCAEESFEFESQDMPMSYDPKLHYDLFRMTIGIPEGSKEMGNQFPLNVNLHQLNGASFTKGCYLGQELTQRTYHTGVVRKVALPFLIDSLPQDDDSKLGLSADNFSPMRLIDQGFDLELKGTEIKDAKGKRLGKVIASNKNLGIAMVDLSRLNQNGAQQEFTLEGQKTLLWQPVWMDVTLSGSGEISAAEQAAKAAKQKEEIEKELL